MANISTNVIEVRNLTKNYNKTTAVNGIEFVVKNGSISALLGGNGAGKTTTLSMLLGLIVPTTGEIKVLGTNMLTKQTGCLN